MAQEENVNEETEATDVDQAAEAVAPDAQADADARQIANLKNKLIRWQADFTNLQRRAAREVLEARQLADADFAKAMLQVLDHFDMALSVDPEKVEAKTLLQGVKITYEELRKVLQNRGIESYDPTGKPFDPHQHEAISQDTSGQHAPNTVTQTFQAGYRIGDRILRPAKVKVSK